MLFPIAPSVHWWFFASYFISDRALFYIWINLILYPIERFSLIKCGTLANKSYLWWHIFLPTASDILTSPRTSNKMSSDINNIYKVAESEEKELVPGLQKKYCNNRSGSRKKCEYYSALHVNGVKKPIPFYSLLLSYTMMRPLRIWWSE